MKPARATNSEQNALADLGRATLQIVHDIKNQLNGLKLYATFLRKRLEREERSAEERETVAKLIAGLDRAAREMTALVRYSQTVELHRRSHVDLRDLIAGAVREANGRPNLAATLLSDISDQPMYGDFDSAILSEALQALTEEALNGAPRDSNTISLHARREGPQELSQAVIEWRGVKLSNRSRSFSPSGYGTVYAALAARIIEAHGGRFECDDHTIRAWLPLTD